VGNRKEEGGIIMKRWSYWSILVVMLFVLAAGGCGGSGDEKDDPINPEPDFMDFNVLNGTWVARDGTGTATGPGGFYSLKLLNGITRITVLNVDENEATIEEFVNFTWDVYKNSTRVNEINLHDNITDRVLIERIANNKFRYTFPGGSRIDVTLLSEYQAYVEEQGVWMDYDGNYSYSATYYLDSVLELLDFTSP
jgi:hypothetical protein